MTAIRSMRVIGFVAALAAATGALGQDFKPPVTDAATRLAWHAKHLEMRAASPYTEMEWRSIGPEIMSGRVTEIAVPSDQPFTFYVATASGGVWKTVNEGTSWTPIFDDAPSGSVGAIAVAPSQPNVVWVGLGEANIFRSSMSGTGVYKSTDHGATWQHMGLEESHRVARIVIHPTDPNIVYVAAAGHEFTNNPERGVYKTTNGGITWTQVLSVDDMTGAIDLVMDPSNPDVLYASMWNRIRRKWSDPLPGGGDGIWKTTDAGATWQPLTTGLPDPAETGRIGLAVAASRPNVVYAVIDNNQTARQAEEGQRDSYGRRRGDVKKGAEVYRSDDGGQTWALVSEPSELMESVFSTYGWVFGQIRVDPSDENTVYVLGVPLVKSTNGGRTFERLSSRGLHADHHALWIDPTNPRRLLNGNDGGINLSYDGGETWKNLENLPVVQFYNVTVDWAEPFNVYGSIQDNGSWMGPSNYRPGRSAPSEWVPIPGGEASIIRLDPEDPNTLYSEGFYGSLMRSTLEPRRTTNIKPQVPEDQPPLRGQWLAPFTLSPHNSRVIYHGMQHVWRSMDRGETWEQISGDLTYNNPDQQGNISFATLTTLAESPLKFGVIYAGTDDGRVHVTRDSGANWTEITAGLPPTTWVSRVVPSQYDVATVYLTKNGKRDDDFQVYVYRSRDYGQTWEDISANIPGGPVNVIAEDPRVDGLLYVGTDLGVYVSTDHGATWNVLGSQLPTVFVHDLVIHPRETTCVIATHGRGMYTLNLKPLYDSLKPGSEAPAADDEADDDDRPRADEDDDGGEDDDEG